MASDKQKRKQAGIDRKKRLANAPPTPPRDGDRRRRPDVDLVREVIKRKQVVQEWTIDDGPPPDWMVDGGPPTKDPA
jgi:hypothetical protein